MYKYISVDKTPTNHFEKMPEIIKTNNEKKRIPIHIKN